MSGDDDISDASPFDQADETKSIPSRSLADFKRDLEQKSVLIAGRWGVRGSCSMHVSTTGSGKSVLEVQSALCFNRGKPCCGLTPTMPFRTWVFQSEDDEDRVAIDRDDILAELKAKYPVEDWDEAARQTVFFDHTGATGAAFLELLDTALKKCPDGEKPGCAIINPLYAYIGGELKSGADVSAFFNGGEVGRTGTSEGLNVILKRHNVWGWIFAHTNKPPKKSELKDWLQDPFPEYKMSGANEIAGIVRSVITFLKVPDSGNKFVFTAGKNGGGLKWRTPDDEPTNKAFFGWAENGKHYWRELAPCEYPAIDGQPTRQTKPMIPPRDDTEIASDAITTLKEPIGKTVAVETIRNAVNNARAKDNYPIEFSRQDARTMLDALKASCKIDCFGTANSMRYGSPELIAAERSKRSGGEG